MLSLLSLAGLVAVVTAQADSACVTGSAVHMIIARASLEPVGPGILGNVSTLITQQLAGSDSVAVDYPATLDNYTISESMGVSAMKTLVMDYATKCPDSKMVLMGYSQGAQVTADLLCGTTEANFNTTAAISTDVMSKSRFPFY